RMGNSKNREHSLGLVTAVALPVFVLADPVPAAAMVSAIARATSAARPVATSVPPGSTPPTACCNTGVVTAIPSAAPAASPMRASRPGTFSVVSPFAVLGPAPLSIAPAPGTIKGKGLDEKFGDSLNADLLSADRLHLRVRYYGIAGAQGHQEAIGF